MEDAAPPRAASPYVTIIDERARARPTGNVFEYSLHVEADDAITLTPVPGRQLHARF